MSNDIKSILDRLVAVEAKISPAMPKMPGLTSQQKSVGQLPALFKPKNISPVLGSKKDPKNPMAGKLVGDSVEPQSALAETMQDIEEDMLGKVKRQFVDYLEKLEDKSKIDRDLVDKAKEELGMSTDEDVAKEDEDFDDSELAHNIDQTANTQAVAAQQPVKTVTMEDGAVLEIYGNEGQGFEVRHSGRSLPTRFKNIDHADTAVQLFQKRRRQQNTDQDYIEEA